MNDKKPRTYYKNLHRGFRDKGMTEGDVINKLGEIRVQVYKWDCDFLTIRDLKEILGRCRYYLSERQIRKLTQEREIKGERFGRRLWIYSKSALYDWIRYLERSGIELLKKRRIIKEGDDRDLLLI